jgi:uncharacterized protein
MKITVKVKPNARENSVLRLGGNNFEVKVTQPPEKGRANQRVIKLIAKHLKIRKSAITIISGENTRSKILLISE